MSVPPPPPPAAGPPPEVPPPYQPPPDYQPQMEVVSPAAGMTRPTFNQWFRTSPWWHKVLVLLPLLLIPVGGLLGALVGLGMAVANQAVLRSRLGNGARIGVAIGILVFGTLFYLVLAIIVTLLLDIATGKSTG